MLRLLAIIFISFGSAVPLLVLFHRILQLEDDLAGYISFFLGWILLPIILLKIWKEPPSIETMSVDINDPIMNEQIDTAKKEFGRFLRGLSEGKLESFVKFPYEFEEEIEHVWGVAHSIKGASIIVSLASEPVFNAPDELMGRIEVPFEDIEDWMLQDNKGRTQGGYTLLAMARIYKRDHGKLPKKYARDLESFIDLDLSKHA